jgi:hypothetical protein
VIALYLELPQNQEAIGIGNSANVITKNPGMLQRVTGGMASPFLRGGGGAKVPFFNFRKIFEIFLKNRYEPI